MFGWVSHLLRTTQCLEEADSLVWIWGVLSFNFRLGTLLKVFLSSVYGCCLASSLLMLSLFLTTAYTCFLSSHWIFYLTSCVCFLSFVWPGHSPPSPGSLASTVFPSHSSLSVMLALPFITHHTRFLPVWGSRVFSPVLLCSSFV